MNSQIGNDGELQKCISGNSEGRVELKSPPVSLTIALVFAAIWFPSAIWLSLTLNRFDPKLFAFVSIYFIIRICAYSATIIDPVKTFVSKEGIEQEYQDEKLILPWEGIESIEEHSINVILRGQVTQARLPKATVPAYRILRLKLEILSQNLVNFKTWSNLLTLIQAKDFKSLSAWTRKAFGYDARIPGSALGQGFDLFKRQLTELGSQKIADARFLARRKSEVASELFLYLLERISTVLATGAIVLFLEFYNVLDVLYEPAIYWKLAVPVSVVGAVAVACLAYAARGYLLEKASEKERKTLS